MYQSEDLDQYEKMQCEKSERYEHAINKKQMTKNMNRCLVSFVNLHPRKTPFHNYQFFNYILTASRHSYWNSYLCAI